MLLSKSLLIVLLCFDIISVLIILVGALSPRLSLYPVWHRIGLFLCMLGLLGQIGAIFEYFFTDNPRVFIEMPIAALKDIGIGVLGLTWAGRRFIAWLDKDEKKVVKKPRQRRTRNVNIPVKRRSKVE